MLNQKILEYVDDVISKINASEMFKVKLENELIRHIIETSEYTSIDEVLDKLGSPEKLADEMSRKLVNESNKQSDGNFMEFSEQKNTKLTKIPDRSCEEAHSVPNYDRHVSPRYCGEYTREESNVNIKLLYIPLLQISSGIERIRLPLLGEYYID
jgi:(p)ppGpp synthase/HD superfamily hydrolase